MFSTLITCSLQFIERTLKVNSKIKTLYFQTNPEEVCGKPSLTPVYFNKQVLVRYLYDSRFYCEFASETYGTVYGDDFFISFGINKNGSVIAWLGDLKEKLPIRESLYWLVENKEPENEVASEFYDAQIDSKFTNPPVIIQCLNSLSQFNAAFHKKFGIHLYKDRSIDERIEETRRYKRLLLNNIDDFKRFISELNEIINENTNNKEIRHFLESRSISVGDKNNGFFKGNKLLDQTYKCVLADKENLIAPFFYLYDLRLWADHTMGNDKLVDIAEKLKIPSDNYQLILDTLVTEMCFSIEKLIKNVTNETFKNIRTS